MLSKRRLFRVHELRKALFVDSKTQLNIKYLKEEVMIFKADDELSEIISLTAMIIVEIDKKNKLAHIDCGVPNGFKLSCINKFNSISRPTDYNRIDINFLLSINMLPIKFTKLAKIRKKGVTRIKRYQKKLFKRETKTFSMIITGKEKRLKSTAQAIKEKRNHLREFFKCVRLNII